MSALAPRPPRDMRAWLPLVVLALFLVPNGLVLRAQLQAPSVEAVE